LHFVDHAGAQLENGHGAGIERGAGAQALHQVVGGLELRRGAGRGLRLPGGGGRDPGDERRAQGRGGEARARTLAFKWSHRHGPSHGSSPSKFAAIAR